MKTSRKATIGLLLITIMAALQYVFVANVPDSVSAFSYTFITYLVGFAVLGIARIKSFKLITKKTLLKGLLMAAELLGFNVFMILGSRNMESVVISSVLSMYFVFVTPLLLLLKKKVSFRSAIASLVAVIALLLMFGADTEVFFESPNVLYLILSDICFAAYVITISVMGENEDSSALTLAQMIFSVILSFIGWAFMVIIGQASFGYPTDKFFWISVLFMGLFIRALYGIVQVSCQKFVPPITASLIFASEIIITLISDPIMTRILHTEYTPVTIYQVIGCIFFVLAMLVVDDDFMQKFGYSDMKEKTYIDDTGVHPVLPVSRKIVNLTLSVSITALLIATVICIAAIQDIRHTSVDTSRSLGDSASESSETALTSQLETEMLNQADYKADIADKKLTLYADLIEGAASSAGALLSSPESYEPREVMYPLKENADKWAMQRTLNDESVSYSDVENQSFVFGYLEEDFEHIVESAQTVTSIYLGTEEGLMISYDTFSGDSYTGGENYYAFLDTQWYKDCKSADKTMFTSAYEDSYGRGLTVSCVTPIHDDKGRFKGCVAMDILMKDMNSSMVNDGIEEPSWAVLIDRSGAIIAGNEDDRNADVESINDVQIAGIEVNTIADKLCSGIDGIASIGEGDGAVYVAYSNIESIGWVMCIMTPIADVIEPAVAIGEQMNENTTYVEKLIVESIREVIQRCLVLFAALVLIITLVVGGFSRKISNPLVQLEDEVMTISQGNLDLRTDINSNDEIGSLARAFNYMAETLQKYIKDLTQAVAREERIAAELSFASKIQAEMLPTDFPSTEEYSLCASMKPAKETGGDFYDFFRIDDKRFALVIADVSGKGVPAALFMVQAMTVLKSELLKTRDIGEALSNANNLLCERNASELFVTVWACVLDLTTGEAVASNAGHEFPAIRRAGGAFELFKDKHSMPLASMEGIKYKSYELTINPGDTVFVYTDGVAEATNAELQMFGTDNMLEALNKDSDAEPADLINAVTEGIHGFVKDAEQFDDITMLSFKYKKYL